MITCHLRYETDTLKTKQVEAHGRRALRAILCR
jgi:hypothetical protein